MTTLVYGSGANVVINHLAGATKTPGLVEEMADCIGVWLDDVANGAYGPLLIMGEVTLTKAAGTAYAVGDKLYWDTTGDTLTKTKTDVPCGICTLAAGSAATSARVFLNPGIEEEP
jgi:predicted RecA/RadA family phage recombinase